MVKRLTFTPPKISLALLLSALAISGCNVSIGPAAVCHNPFICHDEGFGLLAQRMSSDLLEAFDAAEVSLDYSAGNVTLTQASGQAYLTLTLEDSTEVSNTFGWVRQGQEIRFSNPASVNSWVAPYLSQLSEFEYNVHGLSVQSQTGVNVFASELKYSNHVVAGSTDSFYVPIGGWCDPVTGVCYEPKSK